MTRYYLISSQTPQKQIYIKDNTFKIGSGKEADLKIDRPSVKDVHLILFPQDCYCIAQGPDCYIISSNDNTASTDGKIDLEMNCKYDYTPNDTIGLKDFTFTINKEQTAESQVSFPLEAVEQAELIPKRSTVVHTTPGAIKGADLNINIGSLDVQSEICPVDSHGDFVQSVGDVELVKDCGVPATIDKEKATEIPEEEPKKVGTELKERVVTSEVYVRKEEAYQEMISPIAQQPFDGEMEYADAMEDRLESAEPMGEIPALKTNNNYNVMGNIFMDTPSMASESVKTPVFMDDNDLNLSKYKVDVISDIEQRLCDKEREFDAKTSMLFEEIEDRVDLMEERIGEVEEKMNEIKDGKIADVKRMHIEGMADKEEKSAGLGDVTVTEENVASKGLADKTEKSAGLGDVTVTKENVASKGLADKKDTVLNGVIKDLTDNGKEAGVKKGKVGKEDVLGKDNKKDAAESHESMGDEKRVKEDDVKKELTDNVEMEEVKEKKKPETNEFKEKIKKDVEVKIKEELKEAVKKDIKEKQPVSKKGKKGKEKAAVGEGLTDSKEDTRESSEKKGRGRATKKAVESSGEKKPEEKKGTRGRKKTNVVEDEKKPAKTQKRKSAVKADIPSKKKK